MELLLITRQIHRKAVEQRATLIHRLYNQDWGTSYSRPPIDSYLTPPCYKNPGGATDMSDSIAAERDNDDSYEAASRRSQTRPISVRRSTDVTLRHCHAPAAAAAAAVCDSLTGARRSADSCIQVSLLRWTTLLRWCRFVTRAFSLWN